MTYLVIPYFFGGSSTCKMELQIEGRHNNFVTDPKIYKEYGMELPQITTLEDLIKELRKIFDADTVNVDLVHYLMKSYKSNPAEWKKYAKFDRHR